MTREQLRTLFEKWADRYNWPDWNHTPYPIKKEIIFETFIWPLYEALDEISAADGLLYKGNIIERRDTCGRARKAKADLAKKLGVGMSDHKTIMACGLNWGKASRFALDTAKEILNITLAAGLRDIHVVIYPTEEIQKLKDRVRELEYELSVQKELT